MAIVRKTLEEIKNYRPTNEDLARLQTLKEMKDEDIDFSDIPELTSEDFARAIPADKFWEMRQQAQINKPEGAIISIDKKILIKFQNKAKQTGNKCQTLIDEALEEYLLAH